MMIKTIYGGFDGAPDPLSYAFLGPLIGGAVRALSGGLFDKIGGSKGMHWTTLGQIAGCLALVFGGFLTPTSLDQFQGFLWIMLFIFLMTGINNVLSEQYDITRPYAEIVRNLTTWYKGATVVVQSLLPVDMPWIKNDTIRTINRHLAGIAREHEAEYLDVYAAYTDANGNPKPGLLSDDGVHLAGKGYDVWAKVVEDFLSKQQ